MSLFLKSHLTKTEYLTRELEKEIRRASKGKIPKQTRRALAERLIGRLDFSDSFQMHKSLRGYADILVDNYMKISNRGDNQKGGN